MGKVGNLEYARLERFQWSSIKPNAVLCSPSLTQ